MENNTFLGLQPYTENDTYRFKGRSDESMELYRLIVRNDFTVCYAESGEGKTSLLNAGVFPLLRENMYFPINITFTSDDYSKTPESFDNIIDRCIKDSINEYNENYKGINVEYKPCCHDFMGMDCQEFLQAKLSQNSWWKLRNFKPQAMGLIFTPVFVFDQFEEVFSLPNSVVWTKTFFNWLEEVSSDSCPEDIIKKVRNVIGPEAAFPTINETKGFKAIFSLRKEFIGELDYWSMQKCFIPVLKNNRYCLKALTYEGAKKVMMQKDTFDINKIELILEYLVKQYSREPERTISENLPVIPALLLSVVCDSWERNTNYFSKTDAENIAQSLNKILECFYNSAIDKTIEYYKERIEYVGQSSSFYDENVLRENIERILFSLVDGNGKRERIKATSSRLAQIGFDKNYKKVLWSNRLIKISKIDGEDYVELIHDSLAPVIAQKKEAAFAIEAKKRAERKIYEQARKTRMRMLIISIICVTIVGIIAAVIFMSKMKKSLDTSDSLRKQLEMNNKLLEMNNNQLEIQKDSIANLNDFLNIKKDSLVRTNNRINNLNKLLNQKNDSLELALRIMSKEEDYFIEQSIVNSINEIEQADSLHQRGRVLVNEGKIAEGRERTRQAMEIRKQLLGEESEDYITSLNNYAFSFAAEENYRTAMELQEQVMALCQKLPTPHPNIGMYATNMGRYYYLNDDWENAAKMWEQALPLVEKHGEIYEYLLEGLVAVYDELGDPRGMNLVMALEEHYQHELSKPCDEPKCMMERARYYDIMGNQAKAKECYLKALSMPMNDEMKVQVHKAYASYLGSTLRDFAAAADYYLSAANIRKGIDGETEAYANLMYNAGMYAFLGSKYEESVNAYQATIDFYRKFDSEAAKKNIAQCMKGMGNAYSGMRDHAKARDCFRELIKYYEQSDQASTEYPQAILRLAKAEKFNKEYLISIEHHKQAMALFVERGMESDYADAEASLQLCYAYAGIDETVAYVTLRKQELAELDRKYEASYNQLLAKCQLNEDDDPNYMWGKIVRWGRSLGMLVVSRRAAEEQGVYLTSAVTPERALAEMNSLLSCYQTYNPESAAFIPSVKAFYQAVTAGRYPLKGVLIFGFKNDAVHPLYKAGDIVIERNGASVTNYSELTAAAKLTDGGGTVKFLRLEDGKLREHFEPVPKSDVLVGYMELTEGE